MCPDSKIPTGRHRGSLLHLLSEIDCTHFKRYCSMAADMSCVSQQRPAPDSEHCPTHLLELAQSGLGRMRAALAVKIRQAHPLLAGASHHAAVAGHLVRSSHVLVNPAQGVRGGISSSIQALLRCFQAIAAVNLLAEGCEKARAAGSTAEQQNRRPMIDP